MRRGIRRQTMSLFRRRHSVLSITALVLALAASGTAAQAPPPAGFPGDAPQGPAAEILEFSAVPAQVQPGGSATLER